MGFSRQEYWSGLPFPSPGDLPDPGIEPRSPALQADALPSELPGKDLKHFLMRPNWTILCFLNIALTPHQSSFIPVSLQTSPNPHLQISPSFKRRVKCHILHTMSKSFLSVLSLYSGKMSPSFASSQICVVIARPVVLSFGCTVRTYNTLFLMSVLNNGCFQFMKMYQTTYLYALF